MDDTQRNKKAVAYVRISSQRQVNNESPVTQRDAIQRYADTNGIEIVAWFEDIAKSGKNADREGLQSLLAYCSKHKGELDYWIVYNMKRASRDIDTYSIQVRAFLAARGITVRSATEPAVNETKEGRFMENLLVLLGQLDNEGKAEVTKDNMRSLAMQGYWQHPPVVGYDIHKIPNELGKLRPSLKPNAMAGKVKQVLERFSEGDISKAELTRYAADIGLHTRYSKKMGEDSINRLLKNPVYAGYVSDVFTDYQPTEGRHEAIISRATFERNQALIYPKNSRVSEVHLKKSKEYPLKGLILCGNCKQALYASAPKTGNGGRSPRYHCSRISCRGKVKSIKTTVIHKDFEELLKRIKPSDGILGLYKDVLIREASNKLGGLNAQLAKLRNELNDMDGKRLNILQKFTEDDINADEKKILLDKLDQEKIEKSVELRKLEEQQSIREADITLAINTMDSVDRQWANSALDVQQRFQKMIFPEGLVYDTTNARFGTTQLSPLYRCITKEKGSEEPSKSYLVAGAGFEPAT